MALPVWAQEDAVLSLEQAENQERCITILTGFPDIGYEERYQFFRLIEEMGVDATPAFRRALSHYGEGEVPAETPIPEVIEMIANPVLRQAAPSLAVAQMGHLIAFSKTCERFISGQVASLKAYDSALGTAELNTVIGEDALFLRQVVADALYRLEADKDPLHSDAVITYARSLVSARNNIEFASFESEVDQIEALFLSDLDGRLARSNDIINNEMSAESIASAILLADDLNDSAREQARRTRQENIIRIFRIFR
jgi:hypothetical protein